MKINVACAAYPIDWLNDWQAYEDKMKYWIRQAADANAQLVVLPEYASMELACIMGEAVRSNLQQQIDAINQLGEQIGELHTQLARQHNLYILAGSMPHRHKDGHAVNRAHLYGPNGVIGFQDKLIMTRFEREIWHISSGDEIKTFTTDIGIIGITICYDSEFPLIARQMCEDGATTLLVPSCTDTLAGYYRVRTGAMARALENQCYVLHAPTVGEANWSEAVDINIGAAAVYTPSDKGFPDNGIYHELEMNQSGWLFCDIDTDKIADVRANGSVLNFQHWNEQYFFKK